MPAIWTAPKDWVYKDIVSAANANIQIRDNLLYLKKKPRHVIDLKGLATIAVVQSTTFAAVDDSQLTLTITTSEANEDVWLSVQGALNVNASAVFLYFDWLMDTTTWVSSGTNTGLTSGAALMYILSTGVVYPVSIRIKVTVPTAGVHTFKLRTKISSGTPTMSLFNNTQNFQVGVIVE